MGKPVGGQSRRNQRIIMWPNRSVVVGSGIVPDLFRAQRSNAPPTLKLTRSEFARNRGRMFRIRDPGEQTMPRIRRTHAAWRFPAVERQRVRIDLGAPERCLKLLTQRI